MKFSLIVKNLALGIIAIAAVICLTITACDEPKESETTLTGTVSITGIAQVEQTLTANTNGLDGKGTISYQWKRGTTVIGSGSTYTIQAADAGSTITVTVTRSGNSGSVTSVPTAVVTNPSLPALTGTVSINGSAEVGQTLTANTSSLGGSGTISYQWKRGTTVIGSDNTYTIQAADTGSTITVTVTRSGNSSGVTSDPTSVVTAEIPPTPGLSFVLLSGGNAYSVSRGTADAASVVIPALYDGKPVTTIAAEGFSSYTNMTSVRIPDRVTSIGQNAFYNCAGLTSVTIPNSVTSIGQNAFNNCSSLTSITIPFFGSAPNGTSPFGFLFGTYTASGQNAYIPASLKTVIVTGGNSIPSNAFSGCTNLTSITIPNTVLSIGSSAFSGCTGLPSITIPNSVTSIDNSAFSGCTGLPSITIPDRVTSIGTSAFSGCTKLPSIVIPNSVTSIGSSAFSGCTNLTSVTISDSFTSIGASAFSGCTKLPSIVIPDSVTSIEDSVFRDCTSLESITLPFIGKSMSATTYETVFGYIFGYTNGSSTTPTPPSGTTYQYTVSSYSHYYYYIPTSLKTVVITGGAINNYAFRNCTGLTSVTIGNGVTSIGDSAFRECTGLTSIIFNATAFADTSGNNTFYNAGQNASGITVTIGANVTKIPANLFMTSNGENIPKIIAVNFDSGSVCQSIGDNAFRYCNGLTSVTIPNSVTSIGGYAFYGCTGLTSVTIGSGVTSIDNYAFYNCSGLTSVTIPNSVTTIGGGAFSGTGLTSVTIGNSVTSIGGRAGSNNYYGYGAFEGCTGLTSITIPDSVTTIGDRTFSGCTGLTSVTIPNSVTTIGDSAFSGCTGLTSVTIPNSVTSIGSGAFSSCTGLTTSVTIPNSVTTIGDSAFSSCTGLTSVTIPNSVTSIGSGAFSGCTGLTSIIFNATALADLTSSSNIFFRAGQNASGVTVTIGAKVTKIPAWLFGDPTNNGTKIISVNFDSGSVCQSIGDNAFRYCNGLTSVTIPNSVTTIGDSAFSICGLTSVTIPNSVTTIGDSAFASCTGLTSVTFATGSNIADADFGSSAFPENRGYNPNENTLKTAYATGKAGTYTRAANGSTWTKN